MSISSVAQEYMAKLFGSPAVAYSVQPSQWVGMQTPAGSVQPSQPQPSTQPWGRYERSGDGNERSQGGKWADRGGIPTVNSPDYWAGQFTPNLGWKDVLKAYGPYITSAFSAGPLMAGLNMMRVFKNPTQDPLWQKAAQQYLDSIGNPASLTDVIQQINGLYKAGLNNKVFASDTARGVLLGLGNPTQWGQASSYGMAPYQFAQAMSGYNYAGIDPRSPGTFELFSDVPGLSTLQSYGYSNQPQSSFLADYARMLGTGQLEKGGLAEKAIERGIASEAQRASSRAWMDDVLAGRTTKDYASWSRDREGSGRENDPDNDGWGDQDVSGSDRVKDNY